MCLPVRIGAPRIVSHWKAVWSQEYIFESFEAGIAILQ